MIRRRLSSGAGIRQASPTRIKYSKLALLPTLHQFLAHPSGRMASEGQRRMAEDGNRALSANLSWTRITLWIQATSDDYALHTLIGRVPPLGGAMR